MAKRPLIVADCPQRINRTYGCNIAASEIASGKSFIDIDRGPISELNVMVIYILKVVQIIVNVMSKYAAAIAYRSKSGDEVPKGGIIVKINVIRTWIVVRAIEHDFASGVRAFLITNTHDARNLRTVPVRVIPAHVVFNKVS
jgi:hypothetical protein